MIRVLRKQIRDVTAVLVLAAIGLAIGVYILNQQGLRLPLIEEAPFQLRAELPEALGVKPGQHQAVRIAFVRVGEISAVEVEDGRALLTLDIEPRYRDRIRADATALLRPKTGLEDMFLDVDPGSEDAPPVEEGHTIPISNTASSVQSDEILNELDADARAYIRLLIGSGAEGLEGHGDELREILRRLAPLHRDLARVNGAFADQRRALKRLVHNYGVLTAELGRHDDDLTRLVRSSDAALGAFASEDDDLSAAVGRLPGALRATERALRAVRPFASELQPALRSLRPAVRELPEANAALRELARETTPVVRDEIRPFARVAPPFLADLQPAASRLSEALPDLDRSFHELNRFSNMAAYNPGGREELTGDAAADRRRNEGYLFWLGWVAQNTVSLFSTSDASGPFRRGQFAAGCDTIRELVRTQPIAEQVLGVTDLLSDAALCPPENGEPLLPPLPELPEVTP